MAIYTIEKAQPFGCKVTACSDISGYVPDENGLDLELLREFKNVRRQRISEYARRKGAWVHFIAAERATLKAVKRKSAALSYLVRFGPHRTLPPGKPVVHAADSHRLPLLQRKPVLW